MKIISIVSAVPGWKSKFTDETGKPFFRDVAVWAVVEEEGVTAITGFSDSNLETNWPDDEQEGFDGWLFIPEGACHGK